MVLAAFVADDFTGATDALWQFGRFGLRSRLLTGTGAVTGAATGAVTGAATGADLDSVDVVGIATTARAARGSRVLDAAMPALRAVAALRPQVLQYKVCSTFDSSPAIGSIGAVVEGVRSSAPAHTPVPVLPAQPEFARYTMFATHFAGFGGSVHRLDRHEPMRTHPSTPAGEADLRRHLGAQMSGAIGLLSTPVLDDGALARQLAEIMEAAPAAFVVDAVTDDDLFRFGRAYRAELRRAPTGGPAFAVGSGGLSMALAADMAHERGRTPVAPESANGTVEPADGPTLAISGSCSPVTARQISAAEEAGWTSIALATDDARSRVLAALRSGRDTILWSARGAADDPVSDGISEALAAVALEAAGRGVLGRLVIAGGDTSGEVITIAGITSLEIQASVCVAGPLCRAHGSGSVLDGLDLVLKGGQVGGDDFFPRAAGRAPGQDAVHLAQPD